MMGSPVNPLRLDPSFAAASEIVASGDLGQRLAVCGVIRGKEPSIDHPLFLLGLPLVDAILWALGEAPLTVTAIAVDGANGLEHWSLIVAFPSGMRASIDVGSGLGPAQIEDIVLRVEWCGTERAVSIEPGSVAVTVTGERGTGHRSGEVAPIADAIRVFAEQAQALAADPPPKWQSAVAVIEAARESARVGRPIPMR